MTDNRPSQADIMAVMNILMNWMIRQNGLGLCLAGVALWLMLVMSLRAEPSDRNTQEQARSAKEQAWDSFARWQQEDTLHGSHGALDNPDADAFSNLVEFTIGQPADSGLTAMSAALPRLVYNPITATFDFEYQRRKDLPANLKIALLMTGAAGHEEPTNLEPTVSDPGGHFEKVVYADVESDPIFQGQSMGTVRLQLSLDAETEPRIFSKTARWCWRRQAIAAGGSRSFAMPLVRPEVYRGRVVGVSADGLKLGGLASTGGGFASALLAGESYYVEVIQGHAAGQRWEVDEAACLADGIALDLTSSRNSQAELPDLKGMRIVVRPHQTLASVVRTDRFLSATRFAEADRVQFWDRERNRYTECWLALRAGNIRQWVAAGDLNFMDAGTRVISPGEGFFIKLSKMSASLPLVGLCRDTDLIIDLKQGTSFVGTGWIDPATPEQIGMLSKRVFSASSSSHQADRIRIWNNQSVTSSILAGLYWRASDQGQHEWVLEGEKDPISQNQASLLNGFEAFFIIHPGAPGQWRQPAPEVFKDSSQ